MSFEGRALGARVRYQPKNRRFGRDAKPHAMQVSDARTDIERATICEIEGTGGIALVLDWGDEWR